MSNGLAIVSGAGDLPRLLAEYCAKSGRHYRVVTLENAPIDWLETHPTIPARIEQISKLCEDLRAEECDTLVFAGAMARPQVDMSMFDALGGQLAAAVLGAMKKGDDQTLRYVIEMFEGQGFDVVGPSEILPELVPPIGVLTARVPSEIERADAVLAREFIAALGKLDIGQGAIVAHGLCLGLETIQGTDKMLEFVATTRPDSGGVLVKALKPGQDTRMDMPVIGVQTVQNAARAGLGGIAIQAGGVMIINRADVIAAANALGLTLWAIS